jgi:hypothetical protein
MEIKDLKKIKIQFIKEDGQEITLEEINQLIEKEKNITKKNFLRGCKHILEKHYPEAIKWFQLAEDFDDSILLILFLSFKLNDQYLLHEYFTENLEQYDIFKNIGFKPYIKYKEKTLPLNIEVIKTLKENL